MQCDQKQPPGGAGAGQRPRADRARAPGSHGEGVPSEDGSNRSWQRGEQADGGRDVESRSPEQLILPPPPPPAPEVYSLLTAFMWINLILALTQSSEGGRGDYTGGSRCERDLRCGNSRMLPRGWVSPVRARAVLGATRPARSPALEIAHVANTS